MKFAGKVISRPHLRDEWVKRSPKSSPRKGKSKVRLLRLVKILCLRFLWPGLYVRFATERLPFLTVSWRLLFFNILGNVTNTFLLCGAVRCVNEICQLRSWTKVREERQHSTGLMTSVLSLHLSLFGIGDPKTLFQPFRAFFLRFLFLSTN